jgi:hypothetical protein
LSAEKDRLAERSAVLAAARLAGAGQERAQVTRQRIELAHIAAHLSARADFGGI